MYVHTDETSTVKYFDLLSVNMKILVFIRSLSTEISKLRKRIKDLKLLEERERELEKLEQQLYGKRKKNHQ